MQGKCRGKVFIINNVDFSEKMLGREASDLDAENLEELFKKLHFSVQRWDNLTADVRYENSGSSDESFLILLKLLNVYFGRFNKFM